jgi:hypothetical protein
VTNDFIDVDGDGVAGSSGSVFPDQLAPFDLGPSFGANTIWHFNYRLTGSGNGIQEFDLYAELFDVCPDESALPPTNTVGDCAPAGSSALPGNSSRAGDGAIFNRSFYITAGNLQVPFGNPNHRGGAPFVTNSSTYRSELLNVNTGGFTLDFASADVPVAWFAIQNGQGTPLAAPNGPGYGSNPRLAVNPDGTTTSQTNLLRPLTRLNTDGSNPSLQVFETPIVIAPVAAIVNYGVGLQEIAMSDLRHANATGRRVNGENLTVVTRDSGSGTRNAFMNGIGLDPSWGVGDNVGARNGNNILGPSFLPSNKSGSGNMDTSVINSRLGIGHTGAERGVNNGWLGTRMDVLGVISDIKGGTVAARPTQANVIDGGPDGYNIVGPAGVSPTSATPATPPPPRAAGAGARARPRPTTPTPATPSPRTPPSARSSTTSPARSRPSSPSPAARPYDFMPGELLAQDYFLVAAPDQVPANPDPDGMQPIAIVGNADQNVECPQLQPQRPRRCPQQPPLRQLRRRRVRRRPHPPDRRRLLRRRRQRRQLHRPERRVRRLRPRPQRPQPHRLRLQRRRCPHPRRRHRHDPRLGSALRLRRHLDRPQRHRPHRGRPGLRRRHRDPGRRPGRRQLRQRRCPLLGRRPRPGRERHPRPPRRLHRRRQRLEHRLRRRLQQLLRHHLRRHPRHRLRARRLRRRHRRQPPDPGLGPQRIRRRHRPPGCRLHRPQLRQLHRPRRRLRRRRLRSSTSPPT